MMLSQLRNALARLAYLTSREFTGPQLSPSELAELKYLENINIPDSNFSVVKLICRQKKCRNF